MKPASLFRNSSTLCYWSTIAFIVFVGAQPCPLEADPIQLQADALTVRNTGQCSLWSFQGAAEGTTFGSSSNVYGCGTLETYANPGTILPNSVTVFAPAPNANLQGYNTSVLILTIPENPGREAYVFGSITATGDPVTIPSSLPAGTSFAVSSPVTLHGSLNVCLLPMGAAAGPCDPNYLNFATINFNLIGQNTFSAVFEPNGFYYQEIYSGNAIASPEPTSFLLCAVSLAAAIAAYRRRRQARRQPNRCTGLLRTSIAS